MFPLELKALGPLEVALDGQPLTLANRKAQALLAYLAVTALPQTRDNLAALLWPEAPQARARASLRQTLWGLRRAGFDEWLEIEQERVMLRPGYELDVATFGQHLARAIGHPHDPAQPCSECVAWLSQAVGLYRGEFLAGFSLGLIHRSAAHG
jgi:DNA-binding SARP family transcriptional activator